MNPEDIQPLGDRVLVESIKDVQSRGGVILPEISQGRPERARVLAVGPGRVTDNGDLVAMNVEVDDVVIFVRHAGSQIGGLDDSFIIFREGDILARVLDPAQPNL